jgi:alpha-glucosidase
LTLLLFAISLSGAVPACGGAECPFPQALRLADGVEVVSGAAHLRLTSVREGVLRVRLSPDGNFAPDASWAVLKDAVRPERDLKVVEGCDALELTAGAVRAKVDKKNLSLVFSDAAGRVISQDDPRRPAGFVGTHFTVWKTMPADEHYFGLGDKAGPLDHRNQAFTNWNTDAFNWQESTDPLYKSIPFFMGLRRGQAYGIFLDNTWRSFFDFGKQDRDALAFGADGGELNYYFFAGPSPKQVIGAYASLTGLTPLPPLWSLGYQQSRWSYYPESRVRELARLFREKKIPADVLYLDIDYQRENRPFTVDPQKFPHFDGMVKDLAREGFKLITIVDLHIKAEPGYPPYDSGVAGDHFIKNPDGSLYVGKVWPGDSVFPDFTLTRTREWFGGLYKDFMAKGVRGIWNDMNEPAVFERADKTMPLDVVHRLDDGRTVTHREAHNILGMLNARATYEGLLRLRPDRRPFVLTRAAYSGAQRYAATWTGDNTSSWNHMRLSVPQLLNLGVSGYADVGDDVGGFIGSPDPDLLTRWTELAAFNPFFRTHAIKDSADREPWAHGPAQEAIRRKYIELRYRLLPYIYTSMEETARTGVPLMRPMFVEYPEHEDLAAAAEQFLFGRDILVAPKLYERQGAYEVDLPSTTVDSGGWYDYWTGRRLEQDHLQVDPPLEQLPLYVRPGAIIPQQPVVQNVDEVPAGPLELRVYPGSDCGGSLYLDDGVSFAFRRGASLRLAFSCQARPDETSVRVDGQKGGYRPWWKSVEFRVFGAPRQPSAVAVNGRPSRDWDYDAQTRSVAVRVRGVKAGDEVQVRY